MKKDPRIDAYIARSAPFAQPILKHVRKLVHQACPGAEESIKWNHISISHRGQILVMMAGFKAHVSFGFWHQQMKKILADDGYRASEAMGIMGRITSLDDLPGERAMLRYIKTAVKLAESGAPARSIGKPKPDLPPPADLATALRSSRAATAAWQKFTPGRRREYIEWITEAKRPETRELRLATTLEWVAEGKSRNWKYQDC